MPLQPLIRASGCIGLGDSGAIINAQNDIMTRQLQQRRQPRSPAPRIQRLSAAENLKDMINDGDPFTIVRRSVFN